MTHTTNIPLALVKKVRKRALIFSGIGSLFLFFGANFLTSATLEKWGLWFFLTAILWIYVGIKPYQEVRMRIFIPDELRVTKGKIQYFHKNKLVKSYEFEKIEKISFITRGLFYGITFNLKGKRFPIFCPFFSKENLQELLADARLKDIVQMDKAH